MDFLSYLSLVYRKTGLSMPKASVAVLNSTSLRGRLISAIQEYRFARAFMFLDNDEAGRDCQDYFEEVLSLGDSSIEVTDKSGMYSGFKDLNEMLCNQI